MKRMAVVGRSRPFCRRRWTRPRQIYNLLSLHSTKACFRGFYQRDSLAYQQMQASFVLYWIVALSQCPIVAPCMMVWSARSSRILFDGSRLWCVPRKSPYRIWNLAMAKSGDLLWATSSERGRFTSRQLLNLTAAHNGILSRRKQVASLS